MWSLTNNSGMELTTLAFAPAPVLVNLIYCPGNTPWVPGIVITALYSLCANSPDTTPVSGLIMG